LAFGDLLSSVADAAGVVPERSSVLKNFPACSLKTVAPYATLCQLMDASNGNGSSVSTGSAEVPVRHSMIDNEPLVRVYSRGVADLLDGLAQRAQVATLSSRGGSSGC
jgi:hypothetical protein